MNKVLQNQIGHYENLRYQPRIMRKTEWITVSILSKCDKNDGNLCKELLKDKKPLSVTQTDNTKAKTMRVKSFAVFLCMFMHTQ